MSVQIRQTLRYSRKMFECCNANLCAAIFGPRLCVSAPDRRNLICFGIAMVRFEFWSEKGMQEGEEDPPSASITELHHSPFKKETAP